MNKTITIALLSVLILCTLALMPVAAATRGNTLVVLDSCPNAQVLEYDANGNLVWELNSTIPPQSSYGFTCADMLPNGNMFVNERSGSSRIFEVDRDGNVLWEYLSGDATDAKRLPNGNTIYTPSSSLKVIEVDYDKNVVWEANATTTPGLVSGSSHLMRVERLPNNNTFVIDTCYSNNQ